MPQEQEWSKNASPSLVDEKELKKEEEKVEMAQPVTEQTSGTLEGVPVDDAQA